MDEQALSIMIAKMPRLQKYYEGVYAADNFPKFNNAKRNCFVIINTDPSNQPGQHWVVLASYFGKIIFADSYGKDMWKYPDIYYHFYEMYGSQPWENLVERRIQLSDFLCGAFCIYFAHVLFNTNLTNGATICCKVVNDFNLLDFLYKHSLVSQ